MEEILRSGLDADGIAVPDAGFDVVNLDFEGSLFQKDQAERLDAIDELLPGVDVSRIQSFVLFVTIGFRSVRRCRPMDEVVRKFRDIEVELRHDGLDAYDTIQWYLQQSGDRWLKVCILMSSMKGGAFPDTPSSDTFATTKSAQATAR